MDAELVALSAAVGLACRRHGALLATAESCTGGWAAQVITHTSGSSAWFERGFVTYANEAKIEMLGVRPETLEQFGAVSPEIAAEMAAERERDAAAAAAATAATEAEEAADPEGEDTVREPVLLKV